MSASHELKGYAKKINDLPKVFLFIVVIAVILEFFPNQKGLIGVLNGQYKNQNVNIKKKDASYLPSFENKVDDIVMNNFKITKVIDGDTIEVENGEENYKVRLIGINTPESVDPRRPVECFGREASNYAKKNFLNESVQMELDSTQSKYDKYGRLLAYVYLSDGQMINKKLISEGYAYEYTYDNAYKYQKDFKELQRFAKAEERGLWNKDTCNGQK